MSSSPAKTHPSNHAATPQGTTAAMASTPIATTQAIGGAGGAASTPQPTPPPATPKPTTTPARVSQYSSTPKLTTTPSRVSQFGSSQFGSSPQTGRFSELNVTPRPTIKCVEDRSTYKLIKVHTAKCSVCNKRNYTEFMLRCTNCGWEICLPCQQEREKKGTLVVAHRELGAAPGSTVRRQYASPAPVFNANPIPMTPLVAMKKTESKPTQSETEIVVLQEQKKSEEINDGPQATTPPNSGEKRAREKTPRTAKDAKRTVEVSSSYEEQSDPDSPSMSVKRRKTIKTTDGKAGLSTAVSRRTHQLISPKTVSETKTPSPPNPDNTGSVNWSNERTKSARAVFGDKNMDLMSGYTKEGHILGRQMPVIANARLDTVPEPSQTMRDFVLADVRTRYPEVQLDAEGRGALFGAVRTLFKAMRRPGSDVLDLSMDRLTQAQKQELDRLLEEETSSILSL